MDHRSRTQPRIAQITTDSNSIIRAIRGENAQFLSEQSERLAIRHPLRLRIAHWELNIGQILGLMSSSGYCQVIFARALRWAQTGVCASYRFILNSLTSGSPNFYFFISLLGNHHLKIDSFPLPARPAKGEPDG